MSTRFDAARLAGLWDFDDPAGSETRFRSAADESGGPDRDVLLTQAARALGLQERYAEGHALLDSVSDVTPEVRVRRSLERGRLLRSAGSPDEALPWFTSAADEARGAGLEALRIDALHMVALVVPAQEQLAVNEEALSAARAASDPAARSWDASLLNNIGMVHADARRWSDALASFQEALAASERIGDAARTRIAWWMVAWALRHLGRTDEARAIQLRLEAEHEAAGTPHPDVDEELGLLG